MIDATMRTTDVMRMISGRIFTPSISSSKKRKRPALEAGNRASFFFLLLNLSYLSGEVGFCFLKYIAE
jgi:hypothetical protein